MPDAAPKPNTAAAIPPTVASTATTNGTFHDALDWLKRQADGIVATVGSLHLSKPAAEIATALEATLEEAGLVALKAGEASLLDALTPANLAAIEQVFKSVDAVLVKEVLARIAIPAAVAAVTTAP